MTYLIYIFSFHNSGIPGSIVKLKSLPMEKSIVDKLEPALSRINLDMSKTEKQTNYSICAEEAAKIFDDKISVQQKLSFIQRGWYP